MEYSLRPRREALSFRTALAHKSFSLHASETSPSTVVTDPIRKIDYENEILDILENLGMHFAELHSRASTMT